MEFVAGFTFATLLILVSYGANRWAMDGRLEIDPYRIALTASAVLLLAIVGESLVNPLYTWWMGSKLWEYRVFPLHDRNVSALALVIWTAYGVHLYFTRQTLESRLPGRLNNNIGKSLVIGFEAPFLSEVSGNLVFLAMTGQYYAYYLPSDVSHLTSLQVVPIYMVCVMTGLAVLRTLERLPRRAALPPLLFASGIVYLFAG